MNEILDEKLRDEPMCRALALIDAPARRAEAERVFVASRYLCSLVVRRPALLRAALEDGVLDAPAAERPDQAFESAIEARREAGATIEVALRQVRQSAYLRILWRMISGKARLGETLDELSALAEACVRAAGRAARAGLAERFGVPRDAQGNELALVVIGMGKLGGRELNVSSDIDLVYLYPGAGSTDGARSIDAADWFAREARALTGLLSRVTAEGFVFRVDTRLRPFGASGPPVSSFAALEAYWRDHARDWERHAMVKARALTGEVADIRRFEAMRRPFVFRRYLDFNAMPSLRSLQRLIGERERVRGGDDVKLGRGGIRELEFLVQSFQLVRGGRTVPLQGRGLLDTLVTLSELELMPPRDAQRLAEAYTYLRRVENGLQALDDAQVHRLPAADSEDMRRVTIGLGEPDVAACLQRLAQHRQAVASRFDAQFEGEGVGVSDETVPAGAGKTAPDATMADGTSAAEADRADVAALDDYLASLCREPSVTRLRDASRERVATLIDALRAPLLGCDDPLGTGHRVGAFVAAAAGRGGYLQVLLDRPGALGRLVEVCGRSAWVAKTLTRQPVLVDELLRPGMDTPLAGAEHYRARAARVCRRHDADDLEAQMNALRHWREVQELRIALAWLDGSLTIMQSSDRLSWLAEALVGEALACVERPLVARHGRPRCSLTPDPAGGDRAVAFAVIAYGKLGGMELGHGSDLDLVFLHDSAGAAQRSDGAEPLENGVWFARLVRRFSHFMAVRTEAGLLYEIDLRLRPNGSAGLLVTSVDAFEGYQRDAAWTWEHQALLRARATHGDPALMRRFESIRQDILCRERAPDVLARSVAEMRSRMLASHGHAARGLMDLKRDPGGITDLEFVVQYLALAHACAHSSIVRYSDNVRVLESVRDAGVIDAATADEAIELWLALRRRRYAAALSLQGDTLEPDAALVELTRRTIALRTRFLGPLAPHVPAA